MIEFIKKILGIKSVDFKFLVSNGAQIIDVRTPQEYKGGHLKKSINVPLQSLSAKLKSLDKNKAIITVCASGMRSSNAKGILKSNGFEAYNGGAWSNLQNKL